MKAGQRVLIIDDDFEIRNVLQFTLDSYGFKVKTCKNSSEALFCMMTESFDYIVTDHDMPGMKGLELAARIRKEHPGSVIIGMSGEEREKDFFLAGANNFIRKPFVADDLAMMITGRSTVN